MVYNFFIILYCLLKIKASKKEE